MSVATHSGVKSLLNFVLVGVLLGVVVASLVVPPALSWYTEPGGLPKGAQIQALVEIPEVIRYATGRLMRGQMIGGAIGGVLGLVAGMLMMRKRRCRSSRHPRRFSLTPIHNPSRAASPACCKRRRAGTSVPTARRKRCRASFRQAASSPKQSSTRMRATGTCLTGASPSGPRSSLRPVLPDALELLSLPSRWIHP